MRRALRRGCVRALHYNDSRRGCVQHRRLPHAWQGMKPFSRMGRPQISASAMVPGPALVTMTLHADIHSAMLLTKPSTSTRIPPGKCLPACRQPDSVWCTADLLSLKPSAASIGLTSHPSKLRTPIT